MPPTHVQEIGFAIAAVSLLLFVGSIVAVPIFLVKIPDDYFVRGRPPRSRVRRVLTLLIGSAFVVVGIAMLVLPGQGILTILVGLGILELPFRDRAIARLLGHKAVKAAIDGMRHKAGKGTLLVPPLPPC